MIEPTPLDRSRWLLTAAIALLGSLILFDAVPAINWGLWVTASVIGTIASRHSGALTLKHPPVLIGIAAVLTAGAAAATSDINAQIGAIWLTAFLLAAFLFYVTARDPAEVRLIPLLISPFVSSARVVTSSLREIGLGFRATSDSPSKVILRRVLIVAPVVLVLIVLLAGADPVFHSAIQSVQDWLPAVTVGPRTVFFAFLFLVMIGACSSLPELKLDLPLWEPGLGRVISATDAIVLVGCTLATLTVFLALQIAYVFIQLPGQIGNGVTYAEYARRGFGQLCVVVTIVAAVILVAERFGRTGDVPRSRKLRKMEFALIAAAALILLSAQRRVFLYEQAYGYTIARVHATAYIVFIAGFLALLAHELRRGQVTPALGRRSFTFALAVVLAILYWNDQGWIMNRNIDRIHTTGKFDAAYAGRLSPDALPALVSRRSELLPADWAALTNWAACDHFRGRTFEWYEWNSARSAAQSARATLRLPEELKCQKRVE